jgi:purine-nucleoside phosphorylase
MSREPAPARVDAGVAERAAARVRARWPVRPRVGIVLGTGLGGLAARIGAAAAIPYGELPGFPACTAIGHRGRLVCGELAGVPVVALDGRFHFYEGYSAEQITLPIHVLRHLGAGALIVSSASGGLNPRFTSGDILALADHIDRMGSRTAGLAGGARFAIHGGAGSLYDPELASRAQEVARRHGFACHRGVYVGVPGPNYETRAEYRFLRFIGGDAVGMSTIPEVLAAARCGLRVLALSVITNLAQPGVPARVDAQQVVDLASAAEPRLCAIVGGVLADLRPAAADGPR